MLPNHPAILLASMAIVLMRLPFWRLPPHVDLALWGSWATYSNKFFPPARLLEFNQGGSRLALFSQYRVGTYFTSNILIVQHVVDAICVFVAAYATFLFLGTSTPALLTVWLAFIAINNPRTQTYFANSETQILAGLAVVLLLLRNGSVPACVAAGLILSFHCTFHKVTFGTDWLVGFFFAKYRIPYVAGSAVLAVAWLVLQRQLVTSGGATSFVGHWRFALAEKGKRIIVDPFFKQGRETSTALLVLLGLAIFFAPRSHPETWLFLGHLLAYVAQIRAHPYHAIPGIFTGIIAVGPVLPHGILIAGILISSVSLIVFAMLPDRCFALHPWKFFFRWNADQLVVAQYLRDHHAERLSKKSLLVWSWHTNLYWLLNIRPAIDWLQVVSPLSYHMVAGGNEEVTRAVAASPPEIVLLAHEYTLDIPSLEAATGYAYVAAETVAGVQILLRADVPSSTPHEAFLFRDPAPATSNH